MFRRDSTNRLKRWQRIQESSLVDGAGVTENYTTSFEDEGAILAFAFAPGQRPDAEAIVALAARDGLIMPFAVSHIGIETDSWVELLSGGLTFDCRGLAPGSFSQPATGAALLGLAEVPSGEVVTLEPAPHLAEGRGLLPVVRALVGVGTALCQLAEVNGVYWRPAHCWMTARYFAGVVEEWLKGGAFPALGLTSLRHAPDGGMISVGLDYLIGQELHFVPNRRLAPAAAARIAVRLVNDLVSTGPLLRLAHLRGPEGEWIEVQPSPEGRELRVTVTL